jgi:hypothetical protein
VRKIQGWRAGPRQSGSEANAPRSYHDPDLSFPMKTMHDAERSADWTTGESCMKIIRSGPNERIDEA